MTEIKKKAFGPLASAYEACRDRVVEATQVVVDGFTWLYRWHQRLLRTNPGYPIALLTIGKAMVRVATPSSAVAAAAVALLAALLDIGHDATDSSWSDYTY